MSDFSTNENEAGQTEVIELRSFDQFQSFAHYYDLYYQQHTDDVEFYLEIARQFKGHQPKLLDLACGSGRITLPLLRAGFEVTGLDRSAPMLNLFRHKLSQETDETQQRAQIIEGDLTDLDAVLSHQKFDFIILGFNSFPHLFGLEDQTACVSAIHRHLKKDGLFVVAVCEPNLKQKGAAKLDHQLEPYGSFENVVRGSKVQLLVTTTDYPDMQLVVRKFGFYEKLPNGLTELKEAHLMTSYVYPHDLQTLLKDAGFEIKKLYGDYHFGDFNKDSAWLVYVCERT